MCRIFGTERKIFGSEFLGGLFRKRDFSELALLKDLLLTSSVLIRGHHILWLANVLHVVSLIREILEKNYFSNFLKIRT